MRLLPGFQLLLSTCLFGLLVFSTSCGSDDDDGLFEVICPSIDTQVLEWFPYQSGNVLQFTNTDSATYFRDFNVVGSLVFADTTYQSFFQGEICSPYAEFVSEEVNQENTILNFRVLDLSNTGDGIAVVVNISDLNTISAYSQQFALSTDGVLSAGPNTTATNLGELTVRGVSYSEVIRLDLNEAPEFTNQQDNDIRSIWIARGGGIVRFQDEVLGTFELEP